MSILPDFPFYKGSEGYFATGSFADTIKGRINQLLLTNPGERVFDCNYGIGLQQYLFDPLDTITAKNIEAKILAQIRTYEPELKITYLNFWASYEDGDQILHINMTILNTRTTERYNYNLTVTKDILFKYPTVVIP